MEPNLTRFLALSLRLAEGLDCTWLTPVVEEWLAELKKLTESKPEVKDG
jgi:hypothetical protein